MKTYEWQTLMKIGGKPDDLKERIVAKLSCGFQGTIPEIAKVLGETEERVAEALQGLCEPKSPEIIMNTDKGEEFFTRFIKLRRTIPQPFNDKIEFYHWSMR